MRARGSTVRIASLFIGALAFSAMGSQAQAPASKDQKAAKDGQQAGKPEGPAVPDAFKLNMLIRATIIALGQANATGNYSVLRDLAAPGFREANTSARLAEIFAVLRGRNLDFSPIIFIDPKLVRQPAIEPNGLLRLSGFFPSRPEQVNFDLAFQLVGDQWRVFGMAVETRAVVEAPAAVSASPAPGTAPSLAPQPASPETAAGTKTEPAPAKPANGAPQKRSEAPKADPPAKVEEKKVSTRKKKTAPAGDLAATEKAKAVETPPASAPPSETASTTAPETQPASAQAPAAADGPTVAGSVTRQPRPDDAASEVSRSLGQPF